MMFCHEFEKLGKEIEGTDYELPLKAQPNENVLGKNWIKKAFEEIDGRNETVEKGATFAL